MTFRINRRGIGQLQDGISDGLEAVADKILAEARSRAPEGERASNRPKTKESLHVDVSHSREWPRPAVFVATASGDGFFVHEGTVDTPAHPFLTQALDAVRREIPTLIRGANLGQRGRRTKAFTRLNASLPAELQTHRE